MNDDLRRAYALVGAGDMGGERTETSRFGLAVFDGRLPRRDDSNYLLLYGRLGSSSWAAT
jgi:hypothetical protein